MNCAMPTAPADERANGLNFDSAASCAPSSADDTFQRCAARASGAANRAGTSDGSAPLTAPSAAAPAPKPTEALPAFNANPKCHGSHA
jgi:hypothetical protein